MKTKVSSFDSMKTSLRPNLPYLNANAENAHALIGTSLKRCLWMADASYFQERHAGLKITIKSEFDRFSTFQDFQELCNIGCYAM